MMADELVCVNGVGVTRAGAHTVGSVASLRRTGLVVGVLAIALVAVRIGLLLLTVGVVGAVAAALAAFEVLILPKGGQSVDAKLARPGG